MKAREGEHKSKKGEGPGLLPAEWEPLFRSAGIRRESLDATRSARGKQTVVGSFLRTNLGREVRIQVDERPALARLLAVDAGHGQYRYYFALTWAPDDPAGESAEPKPVPKETLAKARRRKPKPPRPRTRAFEI